MTDEPIWEGSSYLEAFLVPIAELESFPGNPRRGKVEELRASLRRWGQTRPVLVDAGRQERIVGGHHVVLAATEEGWTHIAVIPNEFGDAHEAQAYMVADNRLHDIGGYDEGLLVRHLRELDERGLLEGTGYDHAAAEARAKKFDDASADLESHPARGARGAKPELEEVVLLYSPAQREQLEVWLEIVAKERGTHGPSDAVYAAAELAARQLNG